jgi:hypothetical protein
MIEEMKTAVKRLDRSVCQIERKKQWKIKRQNERTRPMVSILVTRFQKTEQ